LAPRHLHSFPTRRSSDLFFDFRKQSDGSYPVNPFYPSNPFQTIDLLQNRELVWRTINTARLNFEALNTDRQQLRFSALGGVDVRSEEHTSELQSRFDLVC